MSVASGVVLATGDTKMMTDDVPDLKLLSGSSRDPDILDEISLEGWTIASTHYANPLLIQLYNKNEAKYSLNVGKNVGK